MQDLLDALARQSGVIYVSDLFRAGNGKSIRRCLDAIPAGTYSLDQWTKAVRYLTGDPVLTPKNEAEARVMLGSKPSVMRKKVTGSCKRTCRFFSNTIQRKEKEPGGEDR